jgi:hypothetical protein
MKRTIVAALFVTGLMVSPAKAIDPQTMRHRGDGFGGMMEHLMGAAPMGMMGRVSPDDAAAFLDARIAALHAGLKLSPDQEKLWPPLEAALRGIANLHISHMQSMPDEHRRMRDDPIGMLQAMADRMSEGVDALRKLSDAAGPLYATLDDAQKRRIPMLVMGMGPGGMSGPMRDMMDRWFGIPGGRDGNR